MKKIFNINRAIIAILFLVMVVGVLTVWPRYMPWEVSREREKINEQILLAEEKWAQASVENYNLDVFVNNPTGCLGRKATLQVRDSKLVKVVENEDIMGNIDADNPRLVDDFVTHSCEYNELLPIKMFETAKRQTRGMYVFATFDNEYGFVEEYQAHWVSRGVSHPFYDLKFSNFVVLDDG